MKLKTHFAAATISVFLAACSDMPTTNSDEPRDLATAPPPADYLPLFKCTSDAEFGDSLETSVFKNPDNTLRIERLIAGITIKVVGNLLIPYSGKISSQDWPIKIDYETEEVKVHILASGMSSAVSVKSKTPGMTFTDHNVSCSIPYAARD
jgi:hypothetical protein